MVGEAGSEGGLGGKGDVGGADGRSVEGGALADDAGEEVAVEGVVDGAEDGFAVGPEAHGGAAEGHVAGVVEGAVEGVDDPHGGVFVERAVFAGFFGEDGQGEAGGEGVEDEGFGAAVGFEFDVVGEVAEDGKGALDERQEKVAGGADGGGGGGEGGLFFGGGERHGIPGESGRRGGRGQNSYGEVVSGRI